MEEELGAYDIMLYIHVVFIAIYSLVLAVRLVYLFSGRVEDLLLFKFRAKVLNFILLSVIVVTGIYLGFNYDFTYGKWFVFKLAILGLAVFLGDYTFRKFNKLTGLATLLLFVYLFALSYTKNISLFIE